MSSIKRQKTCLRSDSLKRQSFSERICDDLCEVILQYLPLKDKLVLESVSKQFQRTILQKQCELNFVKHRYSCVENRLFKNQNFDLKSLESLLKKCPNITSIELNDINYDTYGCNNYNEFIVLIIKNCNNLVEFKCCLGEISEITFNEFKEKFGSKIKTIYQSLFPKQKINLLKCFDAVEGMYTMILPNSHQQNCDETKRINISLNRINEFQNLEDLTLNCLKTEHLEIFCGLILNKMKRLSIIPLKLEEELATRILDNFTNIQSLHLNCRSGFEFDQNVENVILKSVSKLQNLIELKVHSRYGLNDTLFGDSLKQITINCKKIMSFECYLRINAENAANIKQLLSPLKAFKQLKRLHLKFFSHGFAGEETMFSFDIFEGFPNITHLSVYLSDPELQFAPNSLTNIDKYLPKLQSLESNGRFNGTPEGVPQMADILSRLSNLEAIEITSDNQLFCHRFKEEVIKKCRKIRKIDIKYMDYFF